MCWEACFAPRSRFQPAFNRCRHSPTVLAEWAHRLCPPTLDRFPRFSAIARKRPSTGIQVEAENSRNRSNLAILPVTDFRSRAPAIICTPRQGTLGLLISRRMRDAETRDRRCVIRGVSPRTAPRAFNPRSRVSSLLIVPRSRGSTCVYLIVADSEGARPRKAGQERMA